MSNIQKTKFTNSNGDNLIILPDTDSANNGDVLTVNKSGQTASIVWAEGGGTTDISIDKCIFVDPENGLDTNSGLTEDKPVATVAQAYTLMESNNFDTFYVIGTEPNDPQANPIVVEIPAVPNTLIIDTLNIVTKVSSQLTFASINTALNINAKSSVLKVFYGGTVTSNINITSDGNVEMHNTEYDVESTTSNLKINAKGDVFLNCIPYEEGDYGCYPDSSAEYYDFYAQSVNVKANNVYACGCVKNGCDINFIADNDVYNHFELSYDDIHSIEESDSNWANITQNYYLEAGNSVCQLEDVVANTFIVKSKYYGYRNGSSLVTGSLTVKSKVDIRTTNDTYIGFINIGDITERGHVYIAGGFEQCVSDKALFDQQGKSLNNPILQINGIISHYGITASRNLHEYAPVVFIDWKGLIEHNGQAIYAQQYKEKSLGYTTTSVLSGLYISGLDYFHNIDGVDTPIYHNYPVEIYSEGTLRNLKIYTGIDDASQKWIPVHIKCKNLVTDGVAGVGGIEICSHDIVIDAEDSIISSSQSTYFLPKPANSYETDNGYVAQYISTNTDTESSVIVRAKRNITFIPPTLDENYTCNQVFTVEAGEEVRLNNFDNFGTRICAKTINIKARKLSGNFDNFCAEFHVDVDVFETLGSYFKVYGYLGANDKWAHLGTTQSTFNAKTVIMLNDTTEAEPKPIAGIFDFGMISSNPTEVRNLDIHIDTIVCSFDWSSGIYCPILRQFSDYKGEISGEIGCIVNTYGNKIHKVSRWQRDLTFVAPQPVDTNESVIGSWDLSARVSLHFAERSTPFDIYIDPNQGDDRYDGLTASTPIRTNIGLYRTLKANFTLNIDNTNHKISINAPITLHIMSGYNDTNNNNREEKENGVGTLQFYARNVDNEVLAEDVYYDMYFGFLEILPEEPNLSIDLRYLNAGVLNIHGFRDILISGLGSQLYNGTCEISAGQLISIDNSGSSIGNNYTYNNTRPFGITILQSGRKISLKGMFTNLIATSGESFTLTDTYNDSFSSDNNCCLCGSCVLKGGEMKLGNSKEAIGFCGYTVIESTKNISANLDTLKGEVHISAAQKFSGYVGTQYMMNCKLNIRAFDIEFQENQSIPASPASFSGTMYQNSFDGATIVLNAEKRIQIVENTNIYNSDITFRAKNLVAYNNAQLNLYQGHSGQSIIDCADISVPITYRFGTLTIKSDRMRRSIYRMSNGPISESSNYTENLYLDIKEFDNSIILPCVQGTPNGYANLYANIGTTYTNLLMWRTDPTGITATVNYVFNVTVDHSRMSDKTRAISSFGDVLPDNATGEILILNRDIITEIPQPQVVNKRALISSGTTVAGVDLDNDNYNVIATIPASATELDVHFPESTNKVQESGFQFDVEANSQLALIKAFITGRRLPVKAPSTFTDGKIYQGSSVNGIVVVAEFEPFTIVISSLQADNPTSSSVDIILTGTNVENNLEYDLVLTSENGERSVHATGSTYTLTGADFSFYDSATDLAATVMIGGVDHGSYALKGYPPIFDGRLYKFIKIGDQTWLTENLDYKFSGLQLDNTAWSYSTKQADYYDKDEATYGVNGNKYGLLYNFVAAKYLNNNKSTLIPGWHVPSLSDWNTLISYAGGSNDAGRKLKSRTDWASGPYGTEGTDNYGFNAKPAGQGNEMNNAITFVDVSYKANFLTSTPYSSNPDYQCNVISLYNTRTLTQVVNPGNNYPFSIRLIKD